jgi:hypothetical protein
MLLVLIVLLIVFGGGAVWGTPTYGPYRSWSPFMALLIVLLVLWFVGIVHV